MKLFKYAAIVALVTIILAMAIAMYGVLAFIVNSPLPKAVVIGSLVTIGLVVFFLLTAGVYLLTSKPNDPVPTSAGSSADRP